MWSACFIDQVTSYYQVVLKVTTISSCVCSSHAGESASFILQNVEETESTIRAILPAFGLFFTGVFDRFFGYLVDAIDTGNVTNLSAEFYQVCTCVHACVCT